MDELKAKFNEAIARKFHRRNHIKKVLFSHFNTKVDLYNIKFPSYKDKSEQTTIGHVVRKMDK